MLAVVPCLYGLQHAIALDSRGPNGFILFEADFIFALALAIFVAAKVGHVGYPHDPIDGHMLVINQNEDRADIPIAPCAGTILCSRCAAGEVAGQNYLSGQPLLTQVNFAQMAVHIARRTPRRFDSPQQECYLNLWRTYDRLRMIEDGLFAQHDLTAQQYNALRLLRAEQPAALPTLVLAGKLVSHAPDITCASSIAGEAGSSPDSQWPTIAAWCESALQRLQSAPCSSSSISRCAIATKNSLAI